MRAALISALTLLVAAGLSSTAFAMPEPTGAMMWGRQISASPYRAMLGGICCTPSALRTKDMTMVILTKLVVHTTSSGTSAGERQRQRQRDGVKVAHGAVSASVSASVCAASASPSRAFGLGPSAVSVTPTRSSMSTNSPQLMSAPLARTATALDRAIQRQALAHL